MHTKFLRSAAAIAAFACFAPLSQAAVLTFEDLPNGSAFFLSDYNGFRFGTNSLQTTAWFYTDEVSTFYLPSSPNTYIATDFQLYTGALFEATQGITSAVDFVFDGAFFTGGDQVRYELYNNSALVYTSANSAVLTAAPQFIASGYAGLVDEVVIVGRQGFYALDDFTYNSRGTVPEPASLALVALAGLLGAGATRRKGAAAGANRVA